MISVIVPIYNTQQYLRRCVDSILCQSFTDFEILLVDDGSTDNSGEICEQYALENRNVRYIHKENGGLSDARNRGIECAGGEFLAFIDSDDVIHVDMLKILYDNMIEYDADISMCSFLWCEGEVVPQAQLCLNEAVCFQGKEVINLLMNNSFEYSSEIVIACNKLYRADLFEDIRYPKGRIHEDEFIIHELLYKCNRLVYCPCKLYFYIYRPDSIVASLNDKRVRDAVDSLGTRAYFFEQKGEKELWTHSRKYWMLAAMNLYVRSGRDGFPDYSATQEWILNELRRQLPDMRRKRMLSFGEYVDYKLWAYNPVVGDAVRAVHIKIVTFIGRCVRMCKKCRKLITSGNFSRRQHR